jgi:hypothetical protein
MKAPEDKIYFGSVCEHFPDCSVFFNTYNDAENWAKNNQPDYRPYYIVKKIEHFEICGVVE